MNELLVNFGWLALGLVLLYYGAEWLVKGAANISIKVGLTPLIVGLTVVAFGTSAPELLVSLQANMSGEGGGGFALGNVIGSNICNIALILGVSAVIRPINIHRQILTRDMPILLGITALFVWMLRDFTITRIEAIVFVVALVLYIGGSIVAGLSSSEEAEVEGMDAEEIAAAKSAGLGKVCFYFFLIILGLGFLMLGANRLIYGGVNIARYYNVSEVLIALSLVALGTSLPELATAVIASKKKQGDIIVGNVVGSNLFNILAVIGITALVAPLQSSEIKVLDLCVMGGLTVGAMLFMFTGRALGRLEGIILLLIYGGYMLYVFNTGDTQM